jgi:hypothetical protein
MLHVGLTWLDVHVAYRLLLAESVRLAVTVVLFNLVVHMQGHLLNLFHAYQHSVLSA